MFSRSTAGLVPTSGTSPTTPTASRPVGQLVDRAARVGVITWGLIIWAHRLPPPQGPDRPARAAALQHADRDLLHDRAAHPGARLLRLHGARPDDIEARTDRPRRHDRRARQAVGLGLQLRRTRTSTSPAMQAPGQLDRAATGRSRTSSPRCTCRSTRRSRSARVARRHPLVLGHRLPVQEGHDPRQDELLSVHPDARGHLQGQVRRALRRVPLRDALQREGRLARPSTRRTSSAARRRPDRPARRRVRPQPEPAGHEAPKRGARTDRRRRTATAHLRPRYLGSPRVRSRGPRATSSSSGSPPPTTRRSGTCT